MKQSRTAQVTSKVQSNFYDKPAALDPGGVPTVPFRIRSVNAEGACIQAVNDSNAGSTPFVAAPSNNLTIDYCSNPSPQTFSFLPSSANPSVGALTVYGGTFCLDPGPNPNVGGPIVTWGCNGGPSQQFTVTSAAEIKNDTGMCVTLQNANVTFFSENATGAARLKLYPCTGTVDQKWNLSVGPHAYSSSTLSTDQTQTARICQLVGEYDRKTGVPNSNHSESRYGIPGTDLGSPVYHNDKLYLLFGDTFYNTSPAQYKLGSALIDSHRNSNDDSIAYTTSTDPEACLNLTWNADVDGLFKVISVPGEHLGGTEVPSFGFSINDILYVLFATDNRGGSIGGMSRSFLGKSTDDGMTYSKLYDLSKDPRVFGTTNSGRFINGAAEVVLTSDVHGLFLNTDKAVIIFGSGAFRRSNLYLAVIPGDSVESPGTMKFFSGVDGNNRPRWSVNEFDAQPLFESRILGQNFGEVSAAYDSVLKKWVLMYTGFFEYPARVLLRIADQPWGPWSPAVTLFDPITNNAYQNFMHQMSGGCFGGGTPLDNLQDNRVDPVPGMCGITYAPSILKSYTKDLGNNEYQIYFDMSTWVPYAVQLMKAKITIK